MYCKYFFTLFFLSILGCSNSVSLDELQIRIWQPEGQDYFSDAQSIHLLTTTAQGIAYESEAQDLSDMSYELEKLTPSDTPLNFSLTINGPELVYLGHVEAHQFQWPSNTEPSIQKDALMFVGPKNKPVSLTNGYPPSLTHTIACQASNGALVLGSSLEQTTNPQVETYYMDLERRSLKAGPTLANIATDAKCSLDSENNVYIYGGCKDANPFGGLLKTNLDGNANIELLINSNERRSCDFDLQATSEKIWLIDGVHIELRARDGRLVNTHELSTEGPYHLTHDSSLSSEQIWLWHTNDNNTAPLILVEHKDETLALSEVSIEGQLLSVGNDRNGEVKILTTEGLYQLSKNKETNLLLDAPLIFDNGFQPQTFVESQAGRWVFLNAEGTLLRMVEGSTNQDLAQASATSQAQMFRGPSGAIFIAGGTSAGVRLLVTGSF